MRLSHLILAGALALAAPSAATAAPYVLDKSHAHVNFSVDHLGFSTTKGVFRDFDADISFDEGKVEDTTVKFVIKSASVDTFWEARDKHIRNKDFLNVTEFPEIVFESTQVTPTGVDTADVVGNLTMLGKTEQVTFKAKLNKLAPSPFNPSKQVAGFTVTGEIDRTKFGMGFGAPNIGAVIPIEINLEMSPK